jgi:hypothetical protein
MGNPQSINIPEVTNMYNLVFTIAAIAFLCVMAWRAWQAYVDEDQAKMWKRIGWGFPISVLIWRGYDVIQLFLSIWDKIHPTGGGSV